METIVKEATVNNEGKVAKTEAMSQKQTNQTPTIQELDTLHLALIGGGSTIGNCL